MEEALRMGIQPLPQTQLLRGGGDFLLGEGRDPVRSSDDTAARGLWCHLLRGRFSIQLAGPSSSFSSFSLGLQCYSWALPGRCCPVGGEGRGARRDVNTKITLWLGHRAPGPCSVPVAGEGRK